MTTERDLSYQPCPVCPHCGYVHRDAWEWNFGPGLDGTSEGRECYHCGGQFDCARVVDVSYTTKAAAEIARAQTQKERAS